MYIGGYYGRVNAVTHSVYEAYPAPGVVAQRLVEDLDFTQHPRRENNLWDLPEGIRPELPQAFVPEVEVPAKQGANAPAAENVPVQVEDPDLAAAADPIDEEPEDEEDEEEEVPLPVLLPTGNLLGWAPAQRLTREQRQALEDSGISREDGIAATFQRFALNEGVVIHVAGRLKEATRYKTIDLSDEMQKYGSTTQTMFIQKDSSTKPFMRTAKYCEGGTRGASAYQLEHRLTIAARVMSYRLEKEAQDDGRRVWSCYDFNRYTQVPEDWNETRNATFEYGNVAALNLPTKFTAFSEKERLRSMLLEVAKVKR